MNECNMISIYCGDKCEETHHKTKDIMPYSQTNKMFRPLLLIEHHLKVWPKPKT
jgi:hypothetical protein